MKKMLFKPALAGLAALSFLCAPGSGAAATGTPVVPAIATATSNADERAIFDVIERYRATVETLDQAGVEALWLHSDDVTFIHPRGHERGWQGVWASFYQGTMGLFSKRTFNVRDVHVFQQGSVAYVEFYWDFLATFKSGGEPLKTEGRENQLLVRTPSGWRISHVHYSGMPVTGARQGF